MGRRPSSTTIDRARASDEPGIRQAVIPPYGVAIHDAIIDGDLRTMKALLSRAEAVLDEQGDLRTAVELLRLEIAKAERG